MTLIENAYDFLNESLRNAEKAEEDPHTWKFAVLHLVQAIELFMKARLGAEHPAFVFEDVDSKAKTVSLTKASERLAGVAGIRFTDRELRSIRRAKKWRDAIIHHEFELSAYEVEGNYVQLYEFLMHFHDERTDFGVLHEKIDRELWHVEAQLMEFFRREIIVYNGVEVLRTFPAEIMAAQGETSVSLNGEEYDRLPYGVEPLWELTADVPCHDCAVVKRQLHFLGCDVEACPRCFGQLISCGCPSGEGPPDEDLKPLEFHVDYWRKKEGHLYGWHEGNGSVE